jgi:hypothetical protein
MACVIAEVAVAAMITANLIEFMAVAFLLFLFISPSYHPITADSLLGDIGFECVFFSRN